MAQAGKLIRVQSTDGTHFTDALAQDAAELENFTLPGLAIGRDLGILRNLHIRSSAQRQWEIYFYSSKDPRSADPNEDAFLGSFRFSAATGRQIGGAGLFRYSITEINFLLRDEDDTGQIHVELVPRDGAKSSYGAGELFRLTVAIEPTLGF